MILYVLYTTVDLLPDRCQAMVMVVLCANRFCVVAATTVPVGCRTNSAILLLVHVVLRVLSKKIRTCQI